MTKKVKISFLILVWSIVAVQMYVNTEERTDTEDEVVTAFSVMDEGVTGETIQGYAYFGKMEISDEVKEEMLKNLAWKLGIQDGYEFSTGQGDGFSKMTLTKKGKYATTLLRIITITGQETPEQHITVQIDTVADVEKAFSLYHRTKEVFEEIEVDGRVSLEVEMEKAGDVWKTKGKKFAEEIFDLGKAKTVDVIEENEIHTVYGYTSSESAYLTLDGNKVNMQVVMSYDEVGDKTYVKVGLPIVNSSY